jgi:uncharacterized protein YndB with AHSA1/START domain
MNMTEISDDRRMTLTRVIAATPAQVWDAWTNPAILPRWFGPVGYSCTTKEIDLRTGGIWRFDMLGPDGTVWPNRHRFTRYTPMTGIEFLLDGDSDDGEPMEVVISLTPVPGGTRLEQTITFPSMEAKAGALAFGAEALGYTTLDKLAAILAG